jgi:hypothetical protein
VLKHADVLLKFVPEHDLAGCSDANPRNHEGQCRRCALVHAKAIDFCEVVVDLRVDFIERRQPNSDRIKISYEEPPYP